jgi:hypothetical protein
MEIKTLKSSFAVGAIAFVAIVLIDIGLINLIEYTEWNFESADILSAFIVSVFLGLLFSQYRAICGAVGYWIGVFGIGYFLLPLVGYGIWIQFGVGDVFTLFGLILIIEMSVYLMLAFAFFMFTAFLTYSVCNKVVGQVI